MTLLPTPAPDADDPEAVLRRQADTGWRVFLVMMAAFPLVIATVATVLYLTV